MRDLNSRTDQFLLIIHGQEGEGEAMEAILGEEDVQVCKTQPVCHRSYSRIFAAANGATKPPDEVKVLLSDFIVAHLAAASLKLESLTLGFLLLQLLP